MMRDEAKENRAALGTPQRRPHRSRITKLGERSAIDQAWRGRFFRVVHREKRFGDACRRRVKKKDPRRWRQLSAHVVNATGGI